MLEQRGPGFWKFWNEVKNQFFFGYNVNMNKVLIFLLILTCIIIILHVANTVIKTHLFEKYRLYESFVESARAVNKELDDEIRKHDSTINLLNRAMFNFVNKDLPTIASSVLQGAQNVPIINTFAQKVKADMCGQQVVPNELLVVRTNDRQPVKRLAITLTDDEKRLGEDYFTILRDDDAHNALKEAMQKIGLEAGDDPQSNFCRYRVALNKCKLGRNDCKEYCPQDERGKLFG